LLREQEIARNVIYFTVLLLNKEPLAMLVAVFSFASLFSFLHPHTDVTIPIYPMAVVAPKHVKPAVTIPIYPMAVKRVVRPDVTIPIYPMAVVEPKHVKPAVTIPIYPM
jgi:hypothetical protein